MEPIKFQSASLPSGNRPVIRNGETKENNFEETLKTFISHVDAEIKESDRKAEEFALGKNHDLHDVIIAAEKADISFQFLLQIRNKLMDAYQELMRMNF
ncbi:MAG: flagellar hook-basal body complex protein FliE [Deltaproteobacteria bacterium]|nr:flagellar hook-basal body complex protein FliE [Deltaproteobacteria bacterium]